MRGGGEWDQRKGGLGLRVGGCSRGSMGRSGERDWVWCYRSRGLLVLMLDHHQNH